MIGNYYMYKAHKHLNEARRLIDEREKRRKDGR
jgi:hypothetical protein